ncbi:MAG: anti-sigma factor RsbA family regulatory protein [Pseudonocardia sp.]
MTAVPEHRALEHQALPFDDVDDLVGDVAGVAAEALERDEPVVAVFPEELTGRIRERLGHAAADVEVLPYDRCYDAAPRALARFVDTVTGHADRGRRPTLMGGSLLVPRRPEDLLGWMQMEAVLNDALIGVDARLVCCHPRAAYGAWADAAALATHPTVLVDRTPTPSDGYLRATAFLAANPEPVPPSLCEPAASVRFGLPGLRAARRLVGEHAARSGLPGGRVEELVMAVNEAVSNTVEHGPGTGTLRIWAGERAVTCEVHDTGGFDQPHLGLLPPAPSAPRGRGLWLIRQLPDRTRWWRDDTGTTIRMSMHVA